MSPLGSARSSPRYGPLVRARSRPDQPAPRSLRDPPRAAQHLAEPRAPAARRAPRGSPGGAGRRTPAASGTPLDESARPEPDRHLRAPGVDVRAGDHDTRAATPRAAAGRRPRAPGRPPRPRAARPRRRPDGMHDERASPVSAVSCRGPARRGETRSRPSAARTARKIAANRAKIVLCNGRGDSAAPAAARPRRVAARRRRATSADAQLG